MLHRSSARQAARHVLPGKLKTYVAYAIGEIALIMIGILLALQVSDWNQSRKDRSEETEILLKLKVDLADTKADSVMTTTQFSNVRGSVMLLIGYIANPSGVPNEDELRQALAGLVEKLEHLETLTQDLFDRWTTVEEPYMTDHLVLSKVAENYNEADFPDLPFQADADGFHSREFANILTGRVICIDDIILWAGRVSSDIDICQKLIAAELG